MTREDWSPTWRRMLDRHLEEHPHCIYGDQPHFVPPSFGQVGFYLCDPPTDLTNRSRVEVPPSPPSVLIHEAATTSRDTGTYVLLRFSDPKKAEAFVYGRFECDDGHVVHSTVIDAILQAMRDYGEPT